MGVYTEKFKIKYSDVDHENKLTLRSLVGYLQEIAGDHSSAVGYGLNDIPFTHVTWILLDWKVSILSRPSYGEELTITTWPRTLEKFYSYRDFEVRDQTGEVIGLASSKWILINTDTKKIERINSDILSAFNLEEKSVFTTPLDEKPAISNEAALSFDYVIQRRDIDTNGHVNNLHYIDFALETLPEEVYTSFEFSTLEIHYKKEIKYKESIHCYYSYEENKHKIVIKNKDNTVIHAIIQLS